MNLRLARYVVLFAGALLVLGALGPASAATAPDWTGHWYSTMVCTVPLCTTDPVAATGFIDMVQSGNALVANAIDPSTGQVAYSASGTASGATATLVLNVPNGATYTFQLTMSADGSSYTGPVVVAKGGRQIVYGTLSGSRTGFLIKGKVTEISGCGSDTCTVKPLPGATVTATGPSGGTATSGADGTYAIAVQRGDYTVTPSLDNRPFTPGSRKVTVSTADVTGVDFKTCAVPDAAPRPLSAAAAPQCARPTKIDWAMPARTTRTTVESVEGREALGLPTAEWVNPVKWTATLFTRAGKKQFDCGSDTRFVWTVKPEKLLASGQPKVACSTKLYVKKMGTYTVSAQQQQHSDGAWRDFGKPLTGKVVVKDWLVAGMGDSNGSGEGNPDFYYKRCNRSLASYQVQTAIALEERDPHTSVTFIHTACSGARIEHVWHTPYVGSREGYTHPSVLPPQISQITGLLREHGAAPARKVDVALVSIGVNDLSFGAVMAYCIKVGAKGFGYVRGKPCQDQEVVGHPEPGTLNGIAGYTAAAKPDSNVSAPLAQHLQTKLDALGALYTDLADVLPQIGVASNHVFMAQYPDFSHGADGKLCSYDGLARMPSSTWGWLSKLSQQLDTNVHTGAARHGWVVPEWNKARFLRAGYCAPPKVSLFRTLATAILSIDMGGPFHPNAEGHQIEYAGTIATVCRKLYDGDATCNDPKAGR